MKNMETKDKTRYFAFNDELGDSDNYYRTVFGKAYHDPKQENPNTGHTYSYIIDYCCRAKLKESYIDIGTNEMYSIQRLYVNDFDTAHALPSNIYYEIIANAFNDKFLVPKEIHDAYMESLLDFVAGY